MSAPTRVGDYELHGELGRGGMGIVYRAVDRRLDREVALKVLAEGGGGDEEEFLREARSAARLRHPGIVVVYGAEVLAGRRVLTLELVDGGSLAERLKRDGPLPPREAARLVADLAAAVQSAHEQGVIHRDLKPANVLLEKRDGRPRLTDFGLARDRKRIGGTSEGDVLGTPSYMSPEQARGHNDLVGPWTDVWGLGAILYECLSGQPPYQGPDAISVLAAVRNDPVPSVAEIRRRRGLEPLPAVLLFIATKALAKDQNERYRAAVLLQQDLERWLDGRAVGVEKGGDVVGRVTSARPVIIGLAVAVLATTLALGVQQLLARSRGRGDAVRLLERVGAATDTVERERVVFELTKDPRAAPTDLLVERVEAAARLLGATTRARLLAVVEPRTEAERSRQSKIGGLATALDAAEKTPLHERVPHETRRVIEEARRRLADRGPAGDRARGAGPLLAAEQEKALGDELARALVAADALSRVPWPAAGPALGRLLRACEDDEASLLVAGALGRLREQRASQAALRSTERPAMPSTLRRQVLKAHVRELGGKAPAFTETTATDSTDLAVLLWELGDRKGALAKAGRAIELGPREANAWHTRAVLHLGARDMRAALSDIEQALAIDPRQPGAQADLAYILAERHETAKAVIACDKALELDPNHARVWNIRGVVRRLTDSKGALADFDRAIELDPTYSEPWSNRAFVKVNVGEIKGAIADASRAIELDETASHAWMTRGVAKARAGDTAGGLADVSRGIELRPSDPTGYCRRVQVRLMMRDLAGARADANRAVELAPEGDDGLVMRANVAMESNEIGDARADLERALAARPESIDALHMLGELESRFGSPPAAIKAYDRLLALVPSDMLSLAHRGQAKLRAGDPQGAIADLEVATKTRVPAEVHLSFADALLATRAFDRARGALLLAYQTAPRNPVVRLRRASFFMGMGEADDAAQEAEACIKFDPRAYEARLILAEVRAYQGDRATALRTLKDALPFAPHQRAARDLQAKIADLERRAPR